MKLIDRILKRFGYVKIPPFTPPIEKKEYEIQLIRLEYEVNPMEFTWYENPSLLCAKYEEERVHELLNSLVPFIEKRCYPGRFLGTNKQDSNGYELRIFVAKPKTSS